MGFDTTIILEIHTGDKGISRLNSFLAEKQLRKFNPVNLFHDGSLGEASFLWANYFTNLPVYEILDYVSFVNWESSLLGLIRSESMDRWVQFSIGREEKQVEVSIETYKKTILEHIKSIPRRYEILIDKLKDDPERAYKIATNYAFNKTYIKDISPIYTIEFIKSNYKDIQDPW